MGAHSARNASRRDLKFQRLADDLRREILAATWAPGEKMPTDLELSDQTGFGLTTVRRAYELLASEGVVVRRQGAGTFVATERRSAPEPQLTIGVLVPVTRLYYGKVLHGLEAELTAGRAGIRFASHQYDRSVEDARIAALLEAGVDGLVLVPTLVPGEDSARRLAELRSLPVPSVLMERRAEGASPDDTTEYVCSDHAGGAYDAVSHLVTLGHTRIGLLARSDAATYSGVVRGYRYAIEHHGIGGTERAETHGDWPGRVSAALRWLREANCTAAVVFGDREATLLLEAARQAGVDVPADLAIVSYDNELADIAPVPLTAVSPAKYRLGQTAARIILRRLRGGDSTPVEQTSLRPGLVIRDSCGATTSRR